MYLNQTQIKILAANAATSYEFTSDWNQTRVSVRDDIVELYQFQPNKSLVSLVIKHAKAMWLGYSIKTRNEIGGINHG